MNVSASPIFGESRRETLRNELLATVELLKQRHAAKIDASYIDDYVALHWMEWHGGSLRLTTTGENVRRHLATLLARSAPRPAP